MIKTTEQIFQSMNGGKHSKTSIKHGEAFTAAFVIQCMEEYSSQQPVPQQTGVSEDAISFHLWMKENDTPERAAEWFHYSNEDMYKAFKTTTT